MLRATEHHVLIYKLLVQLRKIHYEHHNQFIKMKDDCVFGMAYRILTQPQIKLFVWSGWDYLV